MDVPPVPVAIFLTSFHPGGTERQMTELIRRLDPRFEIHVACFRKEGAWLSRVADRAASVVEFQVSGFATPGAAKQLAAFARWCRRHRIAVVHTCDLYANILGLPGAALARVPIRIGSRRELNPDKSPGQIHLQRHAYRCATTVAANSPAARRMLETEGIAPASIAVIPNGIDAMTRPVRESGTGVRRLITVANLRAEKQHDVLLRAVAALAARGRVVELAIVGDGPRRGPLEALTRSLGIESCVRFLGHREDVPVLLAASDAFVLASRSEAFPNAAIEAMAAGLPVVASAVGGLLDLIAQGRTGVLVAQGDVRQLADAIDTLIGDPVGAAALGARAREHVREHYSFDRMVDAFERLYLSERPARRVLRPARTEAAEI